MNKNQEPRDRRPQWQRGLDFWLITMLFAGGAFVIASLWAETNGPAGASPAPQVSLLGSLTATTTPPVLQPETPEAQGAKKGINFLSLLTQGGWFMIPLLILSIAVGTIGIERYLALRRDKIFPPSLVSELGQLSRSPGGLDPRRAYQACQRYPSSASYVLRSMLVKVGRPQPELESAATEACQREATRLGQTTSWLSLAAAVAPLIGLLGTVWGITEAFHDVTQLSEGLNRSVALANGIYVALVTTMVGLVIAIPSAVLSHYYENRIISMLNEIEEMVFNLLPQFERYEGQVRFTAGAGGSNNSSPPAELPVPEESAV